MRLEGEADLPAHKLAMRLWQGGGSAANPADAAEMLIEGDKASRGAAAGRWQPVEDFCGNFAPDADLMSYLAGIKNVRAAGRGSRGAAERRTR